MPIKTNTLESISSIIIKKVNKFDNLLNSEYLIQAKTTNIQQLSNLISNLSEQDLISQASQIIKTDGNYIYAGLALSNVYSNSTNEITKNKVIYMLAKLCRKLGNKELERSYLEQLLARCKNEQYDIHGIVLADLARNYAACNDLQTAENYYKKSILVQKKTFNDYNAGEKTELDIVKLWISKSPQKSMELVTEFLNNHPNSKRKNVALKLQKICIEKQNPENQFYNETVEKIVKADNLAEIENYINDYKNDYPDSTKNKSLEKMYKSAIKQIKENN